MKRQRFAILKENESNWYSTRHSFLFPAETFFFPSLNLKVNLSFFALVGVDGLLVFFPRKLMCLTETSNIVGRPLQSVSMSVNRPSITSGNPNFVPIRLNS